MPRDSPTARQAAARPPAPGAVRALLPLRQEPQLAEVADQLPSEPKFDGYRLIVRIDGGSVRLFTRRGLDWTSRMPSLAKRFEAIGGPAMLDGEMVALRNDGTTGFHDLQSALSEGHDGQLFFYAGDLLHLDGWDLRPCALIGRKRLLQGLQNWEGHLRYSEPYVDDLAILLDHACAWAWRASSPSAPTRRIEPDGAQRGERGSAAAARN